MRSRFFVLPKLNGGRRCSASLTAVKQRQGGKDARIWLQFGLRLGNCSVHMRKWGFVEEWRVESEEWRFGSNPFGICSDSTIETMRRRIISGPKEKKYAGFPHDLHSPISTLHSQTNPNLSIKLNSYLLGKESYVGIKIA